MPQSTDAQIHLVALDLDRTTLTHDYRLLPEVAAAIATARVSGIIVTFATARSWSGLAPFAGELVLTHPVILMNGALIADAAGSVDPRDILALPDVVAHEVVREALKLGLQPCWFTEAAWHSHGPGELVDRERRAVRSDPIIRPDGPALGVPILKVLCLEDQPGRIVALQDAFSGQLNIVRSDTRLIEITHPQASKGAALQRLAERLGVQQRKVAAVGDSENDVAMLTWAGLPIAVANALPAVQAVARWHVAANAEAGVAEALHRVIALNAMGRIEA